VVEGDLVFGLEIIATPGHTPGHISVLDAAGGVLVAGDAINGSDGGVAGPNPEFTADMDTALRSVAKLATLSFDTVLFGHGQPVEGGADQAVAALTGESDLR
jgi:glyoxylase-like metal-dependent hydrolase (beta-lactamase superfamily II)